MDLDDLRLQVYRLIQSRDADLADDFMRRCQPARTTGDLASFFHGVCVQIDSKHNTSLRAYIPNVSDTELWMKRFSNDLLPLLLQTRFPPVTGNGVTACYTD